MSCWVTWKFRLDESVAAILKKGGQGTPNGAGPLSSNEPITNSDTPNTRRQSPANIVGLVDRFPTNLAELAPAKEGVAFLNQ